jgi:glycosyltransferase involved in cell wall biosynthesis
MTLNPHTGTPFVLRETSAMESWIALLGRRDTPVDGVEDYCDCLAHALARRDVSMKTARVEWADRGWFGALLGLRRDCAEWRGKWVLLQYTALGWSRRGFPFAALLTLAILKRCGARCAVMFHEPSGLGGPRWIDRIRSSCQEWIVRALFRHADKSIFTIPLHSIAWLPKETPNAAFIPIGANILEPVARRPMTADRNGAVNTVAIFCLSDPPNLQNELHDISQAVGVAAKSGEVLRVLFLGRGTMEAKQDIENAFAQIPVEVSNLGLQDAREIGRILSESDAMLCTRGLLYLRRSSALAGIACALPIIGYAGAAEGTPLMEAGVELVPYRDSEAMGRALAQVLSDANLRKTLIEKNQNTYARYFSWDSISAAFVQFLGSRPARP